MEVHSENTSKLMFSVHTVPEELTNATRAVIKGHSRQHQLWLSIVDETFMLWVNLPVLGAIHPQSNRFVTGVRIKAMGDSKLNDSLGNNHLPNKKKTITCPVILDLGLRKTHSGKSHDYCDALVFKQLRFQNVFHPHANEKLMFSGLNTFFKKLHFCDRLVWTPA